MLEHNLLTDAEKEYRKMRLGAVVVDHLVMHEDRTVRRRIHQNIRNDKKRPARDAKWAEKIALGMSRRTGISMVEMLGRTQGQPNRDVEVGKKKPVGKDRGNKFSRCLHCGTQFVDEKDRPTLSSFAFCGETEKVGGKCKAAWLAARSVPKCVEPTFNMVTPEDVDHAERQRVLRRLPSAILTTTEKTPARVKEWARRRVKRRRKK